MVLTFLGLVSCLVYKVGSVGEVMAGVLPTVLCYVQGFLGFYVPTMCGVHLCATSLLPQPVHSQAVIFLLEVINMLI